MAKEPVDLATKLSLVSEYWSPKVVARLNEPFLVLDGTLTIQLHAGNVTVDAGQLFVVPRGVEHCPVADGEVHAVLIEPVGVVNTGSAGGPMTAAHDDSLA